MMQNQNRSDNENQANQAMVRVNSFLTSPKRSEILGKWVGPSGVAPDALVRHAMRELSLTPKLRECTPESIYSALLCCAVTGLIPGSIMGEAFLVPFKNQAKFIAGYKGLQKMAYRAGAKQVHGDIVFTLDVWEMDLGTSPKIIHRPALGHRGEVGGAYAWIRLGNDEVLVDFRDMEYLRKVQNFAENRGSDAWRQWPNEMRAKTALRHLLSRTPMGQDYFSAVQLEDAAGREDGPDDFQVLDTLTDGDASRGMRDAHQSSFQSPGLPPPQAPPAASPASGRGKKARDPKDRGPGPVESVMGAPSSGQSPGAASRDSAHVGQTLPASSSDIDTPSMTESPPETSTPESEPAASTSGDDDFDDDFPEPAQGNPEPPLSPIDALLGNFRAWCSRVSTLEQLDAERKSQWTKAAVAHALGGDERLTKEAMEKMKPIYVGRMAELQAKK